MKNTRQLARRILGLFVLLTFFSLCGPVFAANLEQQKFTTLSGYTQLTNFDMDQNGDLYVIKDSKTNATLVRFDVEGNPLQTFAVNGNAKDLTVAPSGEAAFYRTPDEPNKIYRVDLTTGVRTGRSAFASGGNAISPDRFEAIGDTEVLVSWVSEYETSAAYANWLPKTVKVGKFDFASGSPEPTQTWTWIPQWQAGEVNFDSNPATKRLGNSWGYYLYYNPATQKIGIYTVHLEKFVHTETERNHYAAAVTHLYRDNGATFAEVPRSSFTNWSDAFQEPYFTSTGVLMYRKNNNYNGHADFPTRIYLADQATNALQSDKYIESWQNGSGQTVSLSDLWTTPPDAHMEIVLYTFIDYRQHMTVVYGTRNLETGEAISMQLATFKVPEQTPYPDPDDNNYNLITGTPGNDTLNGTRSGDKILGLAGDDQISGGAGDDWLDGGPGNDTIWGGAGNDTLIGGLGDDWLEGGAGDDTYIWRRGDGNDTIEDYQGNNVLKLLDCTKDDISVSQSGNHLLIRIGGETITINHWYVAPKYQLSGIEFSDETTLDKLGINGLVDAIYGTEGDDELNGTAANDRIFGLGGNDMIDGGAGDDYLDGGPGSDTIYGGIGNDTIIGGPGDDFLYGGAGNDTYIWAKGDGNDIIEDSSGSNVLKLTDCVLGDITRASGENNHLILTIGTERITIRNWFYGASYRLSAIEFSDGTTLTTTEITALASAIYGTEGNDVLNGTAGNDRIFGLGGNDSISGAAGDDYLDGGAGNDTIYGGKGNDTLVGGPGDDLLYGDAGDDTYIWNLGDGNDTIEDSAGTNILKLGEGVEVNDLVRNGNHLRIYLGDANEFITINHWYFSNNYQLNRIEFADGTVWTRQNVNDIAAGVIQPFRNAPAREAAPTTPPASDSTGGGSGGSGGCATAAGMAFVAALIPVFVGRRKNR